MGARIQLVGGKDVAVPASTAEAPQSTKPTQDGETNADNGGRCVDRLTDKAIAAWVRRGMSGKLFDGKGLHLIAAAGGPVFRIKYRHAGKPNTYTVGRYGSNADEFTLAGARDERGKVKAWLKAGLDPNIEKKAEKARAIAKQGDTFEAIAREWLGKQSAEWSPGHAADRRRLIERDLLPGLSALPVADLTAPTILAVLQRIEGRGSHEIAAKARIVCSQICRYAVKDGNESKNRPRRKPAP